MSSLGYVDENAQDSCITNLRQRYRAQLQGKIAEAVCVDENLLQQYRDHLQGKTTEAVCVDENLLQQYREHLQGKITEAVCVNANVWQQYCAQLQGKITEVGLCCRSRVDHSRNAEELPSRTVDCLELGDDAIDLGFGHVRVFSPMAGRKVNIPASRCSSQEGCNENVSSEASLSWDGEIPIDYPKDRNYVVITDEDRRHASSASGYRMEGLISIASPTRRRNNFGTRANEVSDELKEAAHNMRSLVEKDLEPDQKSSRRTSSVSSCQTDGSDSSFGTQARHVQDGLREVELQIGSLREKDLELDQRSCALEESRSQLSVYEAELKQLEAELKQRREDLVPKAPSCRSRTRNFLCGLLKLVTYVNMLSMIHHKLDLEIPTIIVADGSFELKWPITNVRNAETSLPETPAANENLKESFEIRHECLATARCSERNDKSPCPALEPCPIPTPCPQCPDQPEVAPCPVLEPCPAPTPCPSPHMSMIRFRVPWFVDKNGTSVSEQGCLPRESRNVHAAFDWCSYRLRFLQGEVDRLNAQIRFQRQKQKRACQKAKQEEQAQHASAQAPCSQVLLQHQLEPAEIPKQPKEMKQKITVVGVPKRLKEDVKPAEEMKMKPKANSVEVQKHLKEDAEPAETPREAGQRAEASRQTAKEKKRRSKKVQSAEASTTYFIETEAARPQQQRAQKKWVQTQSQQQQQQLDLQKLQHEKQPGQERMHESVQEPHVLAADWNLETKCSAHTTLVSAAQPNSKHGPKASEQQEAPSSWQVGTITSALLGSCFFPKLLCTFYSLL